MRAIAILSVLVQTASALAQPPPAEETPLPIPQRERPFLLVDAPRRFTPGESAQIRVQLRDGGRVTVGVFRVADPASALGLAGRREGASIAQAPLGVEAERLWAADGALPRRGERLTLVQRTAVNMPKPMRARRVGANDENTAYDGNESEEDVSTYWVQDEDWAERMVDLGRLAPGAYLVRVHVGSWATTAVLSVGELVLLARRGDVHDVVLLTDPDGRALSGVEVEAQLEGRTVARARTGEDGIARLPSNAAATLRFVARRGEDVAWSDAAHARLDPCDPFVYLGPGRPLFRPGEVIHLRGHVRGCDAEGRFVPLAAQELRVRTDAEGEGPERVTTDADGNFVVELTAGSGGEIRAELRGREHRREVVIDTRTLPRRAVQVEADRAWATAGDVFHVRVADAEGGWPTERDVFLTTPAGRQVGRIGPGRPAIFEVPAVLPAGSSFARFPITASVVDGQTTTLAATELFVARTSTLLEVRTPRERARTGDALELTVRAFDPGGLPAPGNVELAVYGSDGNRAVGAPRLRRTVAVADAGQARVSVTLPGAGPWMVRVRRGAALAEQILWERARPPQLSQRGPLAIRPAADRVAPGGRIEADVRLPSGAGRAWVTLEQGSLWAEQIVAPPSGGPAHVSLQVPDRARGLASLVVTHIAAGRVETASATVEVSTSREMRLDVETDRTTYAPAQDARVTITGRHADGTPADAVITLWLADAGYWELGEDDYPLPGSYHRLPGRMASAADSTTPLGYGAEEGRMLPDARMEWNGRVVPGTTFRHGWGHQGLLVRAQARGTLAEVANVLARAAGLSRAEVCAESVTEAGNVTLLVHDIPWTLAAVKIAELTDSTAIRAGDLLRFDCGRNLGLSGHGAGGGGGSGYGAGGAGLRGSREQRLEGTLFFIPLSRLGPDGTIELTVPMPDHPGRWHIEVLAIADDGGGARGAKVVHTTPAVQAWIDAPRELRPGDVAAAAVEVVAPGHAGREIELSVEIPSELALLDTPAARVRLDARGRARVPLRLRAERPADDVAIRARVRAGADGDDVFDRLRILGNAAEQPLALVALIGPDAQDIDLPLPELAAPTTLAIGVDDGVADGILGELEALHAARWNIPSMRIDRLASLTALLDAVTALEARPAREGTGRARTTISRDELRRRVEHARDGEMAALSELVESDGSLQWWRGLDGSSVVTAEALLALRDDGRAEGWASAVDALRRMVRDGRPPPRVAAMAARALAPGADDRTLARRLLGIAVAAEDADLDTLVHAAHAARLLENEEMERNAMAGLASELDARISRRGTAEPCAGPAWFLCYGRWGERGAVARAARALLSLQASPGNRALAVRAAQWIARQPAADTAWWTWGSGAADELALMAAIAEGGERPSFRVYLDGRPVRAEGGRIELPAGEHNVQVRFAAARGRLARVRAEGVLQIVPPTRSTGTVELRRAFVSEGGRWTLRVGGSLPAGGGAVDVAVPLPAGLLPAPEARGPAGARLTYIDGTLRIRLHPQGPARLDLAIPMIPTGSGSFAVGPAVLRAERSDAWGMTPVASVTVP